MLEIPKYVVQEKSLIGNDIYEAGAVVAYDGLPAGNLEPTCDEGRRRAQLYIDSNAERVRKMQAQFTESGVGDPAAFAAAMAKANAELMANIPAMIGTAVAEAFAAAMAHAKAEAAGTAAPPADAPAAPPADAPAADAKSAKAKDKSGESLV